MITPSSLLPPPPGGRSRSGKTLMPKCGLLSVLVQSLQTGLIPDAYIVPISITYDRLVEGNFTAEQMGEQKPRESFLSVIRSVSSIVVFQGVSRGCRLKY
jgi:glycerol-3-phosphate O-acyltransferase 1/2